MAKVGILVPREHMEKEARALLRRIPLDVVCCRTIATADTVNEARDAVERGAQILVARGYQAKIIRKYTDIPLVEIHFTGQEVGLLLQHAKKISGKVHPHIAVIAFENMLPDTSHMGALMGVRLTVTTIPDAEVVGGVLEDYEKDRPDVIIGGEVTCAAALERGYLTLFYQSTEESIAEALKTAQRMSYAMDSEQQHLARFEAVLDTSFNGIIQVNAERSVLSLNHEIEQLIRKEEKEAVGQKVDELLPEIDLTPLTRVLTGERESMTISAEYNKEAFMLLISPIEFAGRITGAILSFRQISAMSSLTRQARRDIILSGYRTNFTFNDMRTKNARMRELLETAKVFALSDSPVLFYEEEGKEASMIARAIHNNSDRRSGPFVSLDIRDLAPEEQIDALFGRKSLPPQDDRLPSFRQGTEGRTQARTGADTGRSAAGTGSFGADTGRSAAGSGPFGADTGRSAAGSGPFGADAGRSAAGTGAFGADAGRSAAGSGLFGANTGRSAAGTGSFGTDTRRSAAGSASFGTDTRTGYGTGTFLSGKKADAPQSSGAYAPAPAFPGALLRASQGTLFINRIEKLTLKAQHQLLRILLSPTLMHTDARPIDAFNVRIIACAKRNLLSAVESDSFSEELFYHFSGLTLTIPALQMRPEDLQEAFRVCMEKYASKYHRHMQLTAEAQQLVTRLRWPGGFAQVDAFCERIILAAGKRRIDERILQSTYNALYPELRRVQGTERLVVYDTPQAQQIRELLEKHGGDRAAVAQELGISKTTLWRHMKKYNVTANYSDQQV